MFRPSSRISALSGRGMRCSIWNSKPTSPFPFSVCLCSRVLQLDHSVMWKYPWWSLLTSIHCSYSDLRSDSKSLLPPATYQREHAPAAQSAAPWVLVAPVLHHAAQPTAPRGHHAGVWREAELAWAPVGALGIGHRTYEEVRTKERGMTHGGMGAAWMTIELMGGQLTVERGTRSPWITSAQDLQMSEEGKGWGPTETGTRESALKVCPSTLTETWRTTSTWRNKCTSQTSRPGLRTRGMSQSPKEGTVGTTTAGRGTPSLRWLTRRFADQKTGDRVHQGGAGARRQVGGTPLQKDMREKMLPKTQ